MQTFRFFASSFLTALFLFPAFCEAQSISIVSGNGQLVCPACPLHPQKYAPLVVQVNDAAGRPAPNTTVTWTITQQGNQPATTTSTTEATGQATLAFEPLPFLFGTVSPATVVASALNTSVQFVETTALPGGTGTASVFANLIPPSLPPQLTGQAGQTLATTIQVGVVGLFAPVPGIQIRIQSGTTGPSVNCATQLGQQPGTVLTDSTGTARCTPVFGSQIGSGTYTLLVGDSFASFTSMKFTVNPGPAAIVKYISGDNQSVNPGVTTPKPLVAEVTDIAGNPANGAAVTWSVVPAANATLSGAVTTSPATGQVSARVTPIEGPVQVVVALSGNSLVKYSFTVNVNTIVTGLLKISGDGQQAKEGALFTDQLVVQANDNNVPVPGATVSFTVTSGPAILSATTVTTNAQGQAQVSATAGTASYGPVKITASVNGPSTTYTQTFNLTVLSPVAIISQVVNSASFQDQYVSPCSLATIYGTGLAAGLQGVADAFIQPQTQVAGVTVQFGGVFAPILDVANVSGVESVSVQVPCEVPAPGTVSMVVTVDGAAAAPVDVNVKSLSPGIFQFTDSDGKVRAVLVRPNGSFASVANPVQRGEVIRMFATGLGQTTPGLFTNEFDPLVPDENDANTLKAAVLPVIAKVTVGVNNGGTLLLSARYAYGMVGVYELDFQVPENTPTGDNAPFAMFLADKTNKLFWGNPSLIPIR